MNPLLYYLRTGVRALLALGAVGATIFMLTTGREIPDQWWGILITVVGFYFMSRENDQINVH